jgi:transcriptional regulator GlxA family with amidase domain
LTSELLALRALSDLCLVLLKEYKEHSSRQIVAGGYSRVVAAEEWLTAHLPERPSIKGAAEHVRLSQSQLCRLFLQIRKETPQDYLNRIKIDRAMKLLGHSNAKLEKVAADCGFAGASNLCRAFKAAKGRSPTDWRRETYIQYKVPKKGSEMDYRQFGERVRPV